MHVQCTRTESDRLGYATIRLTGSTMLRDLEEKHYSVNREYKNTFAHGRTRPVSLVSVRLTKVRLREIWKKYAEVFTKGVKCWWMDSIGLGRKRPFSLWVGSTEGGPIAWDLEKKKHTTVFTETQVSFDRRSYERNLCNCVYRSPYFISHP